MKTTFFTACLLTVSATVFGGWADGRDLAMDIPSLEATTGSVISGFELRKDVAQYKQGDWSGCVGIARGVSVSEALAIANENPEITFFFYTKGYQMVLDTATDYRLFRHGDAVFFTGKPHFGSAVGLADGYVRVK